MTGNDVPCIKTHLIVRCLREYNIKIHAKHRNQKFSKEGKISDLKRGIILTESNVYVSGKIRSDSKWGWFKSEERLNNDQSPLSFVLDAKRTYKYVEPGSKHHNT